MENRQLRLYETQKFLNEVNSTGSKSKEFYVVSGSRILVTLKVISIDGGTTLNLDIKNGITQGDYETLDTVSVSTSGTFKRVYSDFNSLFKLDVNVSGGNATYIVAVAIFDNASTTKIENAQIDVSLDHTVDVMGHFDSVRIGDGEDLLAINPDGSINNVPQDPADEESLSIYDESPAVPSGAETAIITYVVPTGKIAMLFRAEASGENVARYQIKVDGDVTATRRSHHGSGLTVDFDFSTPSRRPNTYEEGVTIQLFALHNRPESGDFEARLQIVLKDAS